MILNQLLFVIVFFYITNWVRLRYTLGSTIKNFLQSGERPVNYTNKKLIAKYKKKTGLEFQIKIIKSDSISGAMAGLPFKPVMILSSKALSELREDELDWIICHEAGHCVKWHVLQTTIFWVIMLILGIFVINYFQFTLIISIITGIIVSILFYQLERYFSEYQADLYALEHVDNPDGMIRANQKMKKRVTSIFYKNIVLQYLFTGGLSYDQRIQMARDRKR